MRLPTGAAGHSAPRLEDVILRKPGAALLAAPVVLGGLVTSAARLRPVRRVLVAASLAGAVALAGVALASPERGVAVPASAPERVSAAVFDAIGTAHDPSSPFVVTFDQPMDPSSVADALSIEPPSRFTLSWDTSGRRLTVTPDRYWRPDTLYRLLVAPTATSRDGGSLAAPLRSVLLTDAGGTATLAPTMAQASTGRARLDTAIRVRVDRPVGLPALRAALRTDPPIKGELVAEAQPGSYRLQPDAPLAPDTAYRVWLAGLEDLNGVPFAAAEALSVRTVALPEVRAIRPASRASGVKRDAAVRVRFSQRMDEASTAAAVRVTANGKAVKGRVEWASDGLSLTFRPARALPYGARVVVRVDASARSVAGATLAATERARFTVVARPAAVAIPTGARGAVSGSWAAVERYYLALMNCTRTGGWVTSSGACSSPGGRDVAPLRLNAAMSANVARPYARLLATRNQCSHFIGGSPGDRLRAAGFGGYNWGENIGCRDGDPYASVLGTHLFYQREKPYNGGHYRNLMNPSFRQVGIGVWVSGGRVRLVIDLYGA